VEPTAGWAERWGEEEASSSWAPLGTFFLQDLAGGALLPVAAEPYDCGQQPWRRYHL
jgi:hypothetical protein